MKRCLLAGILSLLIAPGGAVLAAEISGAGTAGDPISANALRMPDEGRETFRFDTSGDDAFWGDALKLHQAIAGSKLGGTGDGVSPKTALAVGLKVDRVHEIVRSRGIAVRRYPKRGTRMRPWENPRLDRQKHLTYDLGHDIPCREFTIRSATN